MSIKNGNGVMGVRWFDPSTLIRRTSMFGTSSRQLFGKYEINPRVKMTLRVKKTKSVVIEMGYWVKRLAGCKKNSLSY